MKKINLHNSKKVAFWEFTKGIRTPMFLVLTFVIPLLIVGVGSLEFITQEFMRTQETELVVLDETGEIAHRLQEKTAGTNIDLIIFSGSKEELKAQTLAGTYDSFIVISEDSINDGNFQVFSTDPRDISPAQIRSHLEKTITGFRLETLGLSPEEITKATKPIVLDVQAIEDETPFALGRFLVPIALGMILLLSVIFSGQMLMYGVIKEKRNRVVEILLSSISSLELLIGKIMGYGLLSLLQVGIWCLAALFTASRFFDFRELGLTLEILLPPLLIFLLGYIMLASLFAALGSTMKEAEEGSQAQGLIILVPMIPLFLSGLLMTAPNTLWVRIFTHIPPFIPAMALLRMGATTLPWWEIGTITLSLVISIFLFTYIGSRIFSRGILQYDAIGFRDLFKIIRKKY